jgi:hypothetical protein
MAHQVDDHSTSVADKRPTVSFGSSFWFVLILVGLFIAAVNFVSSSSGSSEGHGGHEGGAATHQESHGEHGTEAATGAQHHDSGASHSEEAHP